VFVLVARSVARLDPTRPVHFLWVGGEPQDLAHLEHDVDRLGLSSTVHFTGARADPSPYFARFDTFLLPSREDPFPLVCLEAAATGIPVVCFAGGGGMPEFVEDDAGAVVGYLDVDAAADRILAFARDEALRSSLGGRAREKVDERCAVDVVAPRIACVLDRHLSRVPS
jgi:glycosyltransferase involved in cell wall biosynthesis